MNATEKFLLSVADATGDDLGVQLTETNMAIICWRRFPKDFGVIADPGAFGHETILDAAVWPVADIASMDSASFAGALFADCGRC